MRQIVEARLTTGGRCHRLGGCLPRCEFLVTIGKQASSYRAGVWCGAIPRAAPLQFARRSGPLITEEVEAPPNQSEPLRGLEVDLAQLTFLTGCRH